VAVGVGVGGMGVCVAVGMDNWVIVMASQACATAVPWTSAGDKVGGSGVEITQDAPTVNTMSDKNNVEQSFFILVFIQLVIHS
jgi:hypothetical protein